MWLAASLRWEALFVMLVAPGRVEPVLGFTVGVVLGHRPLIHSFVLPPLYLFSLFVYSFSCPDEHTGHFDRGHGGYTTFGGIFDVLLDGQRPRCRRLGKPKLSPVTYRFRVSFSVSLCHESDGVNCTLFTRHEIREAFVGCVRRDPPRVLYNSDFLVVTMATVCCWWCLSRLLFCFGSMFHRRKDGAVDIDINGT